MTGVRKRRYSTRELKVAISELGCRWVRTSGSHEVWKTPAGRTLVFAGGWSGSKMVTGNVLANCRAVLAEEGFVI